MCIISTNESFECSPIEGKNVLKLISEVSGVPLTKIKHIVVPDDGELEIYKAVRQFIKDNNLTPGEVAIDSTGGKKSMSVSVGLVGF